MKAMKREIGGVKKDLVKKMELSDLKANEAKKEMKKEMKKDIDGVKKDMEDMNKKLDAKLDAIMELLTKKP